MAGVSYSKLRSIRITNVKFFMEPVHYSTENVIHHTRTQPLLFALWRTTRLLTSRTERAGRVLSRRYHGETTAHTRTLSCSFVFLRIVYNDVRVIDSLFVCLPVAIITDTHPGVFDFDWFPSRHNAHCI